MPPKGGAKGKAAGKGKPAEEEKKGAGKVKGAQQINVRHILVSLLLLSPSPTAQRYHLDLLHVKNIANGNTQCEKYAKKEEALAKLKSGAKFDEVAREFSEDKAKSGM